MKLSLSELERRYGISSGTLRYYDRENILPMFQRTDGNQRYIDADDAVYIELLEMLKQAGCPLSLIRDIVALCEAGKNDYSAIESSYHRAAALLEENSRRLLSEISEMINKMQISRYVSWFFTTAADAGSTLVHMTKNAPAYSGELPLDFRIYLNKIGFADPHNTELLNQIRNGEEPANDYTEAIRAFHEKHPDYPILDELIPND